MHLDGGLDAAAFGGLVFAQVGVAAASPGARRPRVGARAGGLPGLAAVRVAAPPTRHQFAELDATGRRAQPGRQSHGWTRTSSQVAVSGAPPSNVTTAMPPAPAGPRGPIGP